MTPQEAYSLHKRMNEGSKIEKVQRAKSIYTGMKDWTEADRLEYKELMESNQ